MIDLNEYIRKGQTVLAQYIKGVPGFIHNLDQPGQLATSSLRSKEPEIYIRNMLAVGILNRINRQPFLQSERKIIVLPDCLKNYGEQVCCKIDNGNESACTQCYDDCIVFETVERFGNGHTSVVLEPEDMDRYFRKTRIEYGTVGVAGIACALTLLSGFQKTLKHGHPTQGVFLNYSSCAHHWSNPGQDTSFSFQRLRQVLENRTQPELVSRSASEVAGYPTYSLSGEGRTPNNFYRTLDRLADEFEADFLPCYVNSNPTADLFELSLEIIDDLVPEIITREES